MYLLTDDKFEEDFTLEIPELPKTKILVTTSAGKIILENFDSDKIKQLISAISLSGLEITIKTIKDVNAGATGVTAVTPEFSDTLRSLNQEYNVWIEFIILPWTLVCTLGYV